MAITTGALPASSGIETTRHVVVSFLPRLHALRSLSGILEERIYRVGGFTPATVIVPPSEPSPAAAWGARRGVPMPRRNWASGGAR
jgi:hypothetical protein